MSNDLELIRATYAGKAEANGERLKSALAEDAVWIEAAGFPYAGTYAGTYAGVEAIFAGVHQRLGSEWDDYRAVPHAFYDATPHVIVTGTYGGRYRATGRSVEAEFAHVYALRDDKIVRFEQYVDSRKVWQAIEG